MTPCGAPRGVLHAITIECVKRSYILHNGFRAKCACGWWSDCYAQHPDAQRAADVHERRTKRLEFDDLIDRSSIGAGLRDIKERGIDAHLADLEREMRPRRRKGQRR
jgi:hypothetical protein